MNRRELISILGAGSITSIAGCSSNTQSEGVEIDDSQDDSGEAPETRSEEDFEERMKEDMIRDGKRIKGHNLYISDIIDLSDATATIESNVTINPVNDYTLKLHYVPLTDVDGSWELVNPRIEEYYNNDSVEVYYDETDDTWVASDDSSYYARYEYQIENRTFGNIIAEKTVPAEAFGEEEQHIGSVINDNIVSNFTLREGGNPISINFDLDTTPELYEPFVLALSWEDSETHSTRSGEIVTNSQPIIRVGDNDYEFGNLTSDGRPYVSSWTNRDEKDITETVESGNSKTVNIVRLSNSGRFSEKLYSFVNEKKEMNEDEYHDYVISARGSESANDSPVSSSVDMPWSVSFTISNQELDDAVSHADSLTGSNDDVEDIISIISDDSVVNHPIIQDVSSQINEASEMMGITEPIGKLRLICDLIQQFDYKYDGNETVSHPVEVLVNGYADCKDCSVLAYSILNQDEFNMDFDIPSLFGITDYNNRSDGGEWGHTSIGISKSDLNITGSIHDTDTINAEFGESAFGDRIEASYTYNNTEYMYVELVELMPIKSIYEPWYNDIDGNIESFYDV